MRFLFLSFFFLTACHFQPLYVDKSIHQVCVAPISEASGFQIYQALVQHFPNKENCLYTLTVHPPKTTLSDENISDKDFITMQRITTATSYTLLDKNKKVLFENSVSSSGSSAVVSNPYATVMAEEKTAKNLYSIVAEQIALHVAAFLHRNSP